MSEEKVLCLRQVIKGKDVSLLRGGTAAEASSIFLGDTKTTDLILLDFPRLHRDGIIILPPQDPRPGIKTRSCSLTHTCGCETISPHGENWEKWEQGYFVQIFYRGSVQSLCSFSSMLFFMLGMLSLQFYPPMWTDHNCPTCFYFQ